MIYLPSSGVAPTQWNGEINRDSKQAAGLVAAFHPLLGWRDLIAGQIMTPVGNASAYGNNAQIGRTYNLDGTDDCAYVTLPETWKLQRFTVTAWINSTTLGAGAQVWFSLVPRGAAADARGIYCYVTDAYISTAIGAAGGSYTQAFLNATRYANTLYHVAGSYDGTTLRTWQNGVLVASTSITTTIAYADKSTSYGPNPASAYIGNYHDSDNTSPSTAVDLLYDFTGQIGPLNLWNRALSAAEMWTLYDPATRWELYQPARPLIWWIPFDDNSLSFSTGDSTSVGESVALSVSAAQIAKSDAASVAESASLKPQTQIAVTDAATVGESVSLKPQTQIAVADAATVGESVSLKPQTQIAVAESATVAESASLTRSVAAIAVADAATVAESVSLKPQTQIAQSDAATVGESASLTRSVAAIAKSDAATVAESVSLKPQTQIAKSDAATVGESASLTRSVAAIAKSDAASVGESVSLQVVQTITQTIFASSDDGHWSTEGTSFDATGSVLSIGKEYDAFMRWQITLPANSTIRRAYITLTDPYTVGGTIVDINLAISAHDAAAPAAPTTYTDAESATRTTASVAWSIPTGSTQTLYTPRTTPDLSAIIQELANSYDYSTGSAVVLFVDYAAQVAYQSQIFYAYDGSATYAPAIYIGYTTTTQFVSASDAVTVSEAVSLIVEAVVGVVGADAATVAEAVSLAPQTQIGAVDAATVGDVVSLTRSVAEVVGADAVTVGEVVSVVVEVIGVRQITGSDGVSVFEGITLAVSVAEVAAAEAVTVAEAVGLFVAAAQVTISDGANVLDAVLVQVAAPAVSVGDGVTVAEAVAAVVQVALAVLDGLTVQESPTIASPVVGITAGDALAVLDAPELARQWLPLEVVDGVSVGELVAMFVRSLAGLGDVDVSDRSFNPLALSDRSFNPLALSDSSADVAMMDRSRT